MHTLSHHVLAPTATAAFYLTPRQLVSQSLSSLGLSLSPVSCLSAGKCCSLCSTRGPESPVQIWPHKDSVIPGLWLPPRPTQNPRWGSELIYLSGLKIFSPNKSTLQRRAPRPGNDSVYYFLEDATIFC